MKKKAKQAASRPDGPRRRRKAREDTGVNDAPASPSKYANATRFDPEAYKEFKRQRAAQPTGGVDGTTASPPVRSRHVGPGLDLIDVPPPPEAPFDAGGYMRPGGESPPPPVRVSAVQIINGVCQGCLETIETSASHEWWCPWWDTPEGKAAPAPFDDRQRKLL